MKSLSLLLPLLALASHQNAVGDEYLDIYDGPDGAELAFQGCRFEVFGAKGFEDGENVTPGNLAAVWNATQRSAGSLTAEGSLKAASIRLQDNGMVKLAGDGVGGQWKWTGFRNEDEQRAFYEFLVQVNEDGLLQDLLHPAEPELVFEGYGLDGEVFTYSDACGFEVQGGAYENETFLSRDELAHVFGATILSEGVVETHGSLNTFQINIREGEMVKISGASVRGQFRWHDFLLDDGSALGEFLLIVNEDGLLRELMHRY